MSTYLQMQDEVLTYGFDANVYRARVKIWLNDAQADIARKVQIPELLTISSISVVLNDSTYTKPTDLVRVNALIDQDMGWHLKAAEYADLLVNNNNAQNVGRPEEYALASDILISPIPRENYTLTLLYNRRPNDLSADGDISPVTPDYHKAMIRYAVAEAFMAEDDEQMNAYHYQRYVTALTELGEDRQAEINDAPRQVSGTWGTW